MPKKKQKQKQKQKQQQSQNVVVNIGSTQRRKRDAQQSSQQQPTRQQQQQQSIPYLGLQSANNAQLLQSLQTTLTALYGKNNKIPQQAPIYQTPSLPLPQQAPEPEPEPEQQIQLPSAPPASTPVAQPIISNKRQIFSKLPQAQVLETPSAPPQKSIVRFFETTRKPQPPPATTPLPPPDALVGLLSKEYDLDYNKNGTIKQTTAKFTRLPKDVQMALIQEQSLNKPAKAKAVTEKTTRKRSTQQTLEYEDEKEDDNADYYLDQPIGGKNKVKNLVNYHKTHGHTEMKPVAQAKPFQGIFSFANKVAPSVEETDYENDPITTDIDI
jgi:hypothetical protein